MCRVRGVQRILVRLSLKESTLPHLISCSVLQLLCLSELLQVSNFNTREGKELLRHVIQSYRDTAIGAMFKFEKLELVHNDQLSREVSNSVFWLLVQPKCTVLSFLHQFAAICNTFACLLPSLVSRQKTTHAN